MKPQRRFTVIGVTGSVGNGKSTVSRLFRDLGAAHLDADKIAHEAMRPRRAAWRAIVRAFGRGILNADGTIDRRRLAKRVFSSTRARKRLEAIVHPCVLRFIASELKRLKREGRKKAAVLDVPLLFEVGAQRLADWVVVVTAPPEVQKQRLFLAYGWSPKEVRLRQQAQWLLSAKVAMADEVVDNSHGVAATRKQVKQIWNKRVIPLPKRQN